MFRVIINLFWGSAPKRKGEILELGIKHIDTACRVPVFFSHTNHSTHSIYICMHGVYNKLQILVWNVLHATNVEIICIAEILKTCNNKA